MYRRILFIIFFLEFECILYAVRTLIPHQWLHDSYRIIRFNLSRSCERSYQHQKSERPTSLLRTEIFPRITRDRYLEHHHHNLYTSHSVLAFSTSTKSH